MLPPWTEHWLALWHAILSSAEELEEFSLSKSLSLSSKKKRKKNDLLAWQGHSATWLTRSACLGGSPVVPSCSSRSLQLVLWHAGFSAKSSFASISEACCGPEKPVMWNGPVDKPGQNYWENSGDAHGEKPTACTSDDDRVTRLWCHYTFPVEWTGQDDTVGQWGKYWHPWCWTHFHIFNNKPRLRPPDFIAVMHTYSSLTDTTIRYDTASFGIGSKTLAGLEWHPEPVWTENPEPQDSDPINKAKPETTDLKQVLQNKISRLSWKKLLKTENLPIFLISSRHLHLSSKSLHWHLSVKSMFD